MRVSGDVVGSLFRRSVQHLQPERSVNEQSSLWQVVLNLT